MGKSKRLGSGYGTATAHHTYACIRHIHGIPWMRQSSNIEGRPDCLVSASASIPVSGNSSKAFSSLREDCMTRKHRPTSLILKMSPRHQASKIARAPPRMNFEASALCLLIIFVTIALFLCVAGWLYHQKKLIERRSDRDVSSEASAGNDAESEEIANPHFWRSIISRMSPRRVITMPDSVIVRL